MTRPVTLAACVMLQLGCSFRPDAATRLADCVEEAVNGHRTGSAAIQVSCDLEMPGSYLVVLHPQGALREEQLAAAGWSADLLAEMQALRLAEQPGIYVIATSPGVSGIGTDRSVRSSRTTHQMHFADIDTLMVVHKTTQPVMVVLGGSPDRPVIEGLQ